MSAVSSVIVGAVHFPSLQQSPLRRPNMRLVNATWEQASHAVRPDVAAREPLHVERDPVEEDDERWDGLG